MSNSDLSDAALFGADVMGFDYDDELEVSAIDALVMGFDYDDEFEVDTVPEALIMAFDCEDEVVMNVAQRQLLEEIAVSMVDSGTMSLAWAEVMVLATELPTLEEHLFLQERAGNIAVGTKAHIMGLINSVA